MSANFTSSNASFWDRFEALAEAPRVIRAFGQQDLERSRVAQAIEGLRRSANAIQYQSAIVHALVDSLIAVLFLTLLLAGYWGGVSIPVITAFLILAVRAQPQAKAISTARLGVAAAHGSIKEVEWLLSQKPPNRPSRYPFKIPAGPTDRIAVRVVSLSEWRQALGPSISRSSLGKARLEWQIRRRKNDHRPFAVPARRSQSARFALRESPPLPSLAYLAGRVAIAGQDARTRNRDRCGKTSLMDGRTRPIFRSRRSLALPARKISSRVYQAAMATLVGPRGATLGWTASRIGLARALLRGQTC